MRLIVAFCNFANGPTKPLRFRIEARTAVASKIEGQNLRQKRRQQRKKVHQGNAFCHERQGCKNPRRLVAIATKLCTVAPNIFSTIT
jgi:hypothetical protein